MTCYAHSFLKYGNRKLLNNPRKENSAGGRVVEGGGGGFWGEFQNNHEYLESIV